MEGSSSMFKLHSLDVSFAVSLRPRPRHLKDEVVTFVLSFVLPGFVTFVLMLFLWFELFLLHLAGRGEIYFWGMLLFMLLFIFAVSLRRLYKYLKRKRLEAESLLSFPSLTSPFLRTSAACSAWPLSLSFAPRRCQVITHFGAGRWGE